MKFIFLISIFLHLGMSNALAKVSCLKTDIKSYIRTDSKTSKMISIVVKGHELVFVNDSCGAHGCEYFVFSEVFPGCRVLSFNKKGFLIPKSFNGTRFVFKVDDKSKKYLYSSKKNKFEYNP